MSTADTKQLNLWAQQIMTLLSITTANTDQIQHILTTKAASTADTQNRPMSTADTDNWICESSRYWQYYQWLQQIQTKYSRYWLLKHRVQQILKIDQWVQQILTNESVSAADTNNLIYNYPQQIRTKYNRYYQILTTEVPSTADTEKWICEYSVIADTDNWVGKLSRYWIQSICWQL